MIGDQVTISVNADGTGAIYAVAPRERVLSRVEPSNFAGTSTEREQVIIANPDQAIFVFACANPVPHVRLLDRFLVMAEKAAIPTICICANKVDLIGMEAARSLFAIYEQIGYSIFTPAPSKTSVLAICGIAYMTRFRCLPDRPASGRAACSTRSSQGWHVP